MGEILEFLLIAALSSLVMGMIWLFASEVAEAIVEKKGNPFQNLKNRLQILFTKYETYHVARIIHNDDWYYDYNELIYIVDDAVKVPVTCSKQDKEKIRQLQRLNPEQDVYIKAKVDRGTLELVKVKGYTVK